MTDPELWQAVRSADRETLLNQAILWRQTIHEQERRIADMEQQLAAKHDRVAELCEDKSRMTAEWRREREVWERTLAEQGAARDRALADADRYFDWAMALGARISYLYDHLDVRHGCRAARAKTANEREWKHDGWCGTRTDETTGAAGAAGATERAED